MLPGCFEQMNRLGSESRPFLFILDFDLSEPLVLTPEEAEAAGILFRINDIGNHDDETPSPKPFVFQRRPVTESQYLESFNRVMDHIRTGNTYLVNLTFPTPIETDLTLTEIYHRSEARYKLLVPDRFVVFSPEIFVQINQGVISSNPMKGTLDARVPDAENLLLSDPKELAEHYTIVDLIRNDLNLVAQDVKVERFRYLDRIRTNFSTLLQVSSRITGRLDPGYTDHIGEILFSLLPAGSVTGAPKQRTVEIIRETECYERGYYTGVMGFFDGNTLDSGVMIRYIEQTPTGLVFKSGGGITFQSDPREEYREMVEKVYVPFT